MRHDKTSSRDLGKIAAENRARSSERGILPPGAFGRLSSPLDVPLLDVRELLFLPVEDVAFEAYRLEGRRAASGSTPKSSKYPEEV
jgi:hypothetical protein